MRVFLFLEDTRIGIAEVIYAVVCRRGVDGVTRRRGSRARIRLCCAHGRSTSATFQGIRRIWARGTACAPVPLAMLPLDPSQSLNLLTSGRMGGSDKREASGHTYS